jgi:hypothetical protein
MTVVFESVALGRGPAKVAEQIEPIQSLNDGLPFV